MSKRDRLNPDSKFYNMGESKATKEYLKTLNQIRKEKGALAATGYEVKSTLYSLANRIWHTLAVFKSGAELATEDFAAFGGASRPSTGCNKTRFFVSF